MAGLRQVAVSRLSHSNPQLRAHFGLFEIHASPVFEPPPSRSQHHDSTNHHSRPKFSPPPTANMRTYDDSFSGQRIYPGKVPTPNLQSCSPFNAFPGRHYRPHPGLSSSHGSGVKNSPPSKGRNGSCYKGGSIPKN